MAVLVDTVIFDFDGVLVDTGPDVAGAANDTLAALGLATLPVPVVVSFIGGGAEILMRRCLAQKTDELLAVAVPMFVQRYAERCCVETRLYPEVQNVLDAYAQAGKHMAIATQKVEAITRTILDHFKLAGYFEVLVGPESVTHRKPHPESVLRILDATHTAPTRAVLIGDTASDIKAGKAAGIWTCGVKYGYGSAEEIEAEKPDWALDHLNQMLEWIC